MEIATTDQTAERAPTGSVAPGTFLLNIDAPYITVTEYARRTGQTREAVYLQCRAGKLPVRPRKDNQPYLINIALLTAQALSAKY